MKTISDLFRAPVEELDTQQPMRTAEEAARLVEAYKAVFAHEDGELVLVDILKACGYYHTTPIGVTSTTLHELEGGRRVGAHILNRMSVDLATLRNAGSAVGRESRADTQKGQL